jgi:hypothetical protein
MEVATICSLHQVPRNRKGYTGYRSQAKIMDECTYSFNSALYFPERSIKDREELLAILPEMCGPKCVNGVSWLLYENPMLILDDTNAFFEAHKVDDITMDLVTYATFLSQRCCSCYMTGHVLSFALSYLSLVPGLTNLFLV